jgi:predicted enzyme related to lactoylglutathione lyase
MPVTGPDFIALQVNDIEESAKFYEKHLGLNRTPHGPTGAVVFTTSPIPFAVREPLPGVDLSAATPRPGIGVALWLHAEDSQDVHDTLAEAGVKIVAPPFDGPFGRTFSFSDPDGYVITIHDKA